MGRQKSKSCAYRVGLVDDYRKKPKDELVEEVVDKVIEIDKLKKKLRRYENPKIHGIRCQSRLHRNT